MFTDDQFTRYMNDRFPAIGDSRRRKTRVAEPPKTPFVLLAPVEPNGEKCKNSANQAALPLSEAA